MNEVLDDHTLTKRLQKRVKELELQLAKKEELVCSLMVLMSGSQSKCLVVDVMTSVGVFLSKFLVFANILCRLHCSHV